MTRVKIGTDDVRCFIVRAAHGDKSDKHYLVIDLPKEEAKHLLAASEAWQKAELRLSQLYNEHERTWKG